MREWLKKVGVGLTTAALNLVEDRSFVAQTVRLADEEALARLRERVRSLDDARFVSFRRTVNTIIAEAQRNYEAARSAAQNQWGGFVEDRIAMLQAHVAAGRDPYATPEVQEAEQWLRRLQALADHADRFRQELRSESASPPDPPTIATSYPNPERRELDSEPASAPETTTRHGRMSGTDPLESARSFQRHLDNILGSRGDAIADTGGGDDWSRLSDVELAQKLLEIDRRTTRALADTLPGRVQADVVDRLDMIVADYRRLAAIDRGGPLLATFVIEGKLAEALRMLGRAHDSLEDPAAAKKAYQESLGLYERLGKTDEAASVDRGLRDLQLRLDRDVDSTIAELRDQLEIATDAVERASLMVELAEIHATNHDDLEAEDLYVSAEEALQPYHDQVSGTGTATALASSMSAMMAGRPLTGSISIDQVMRIRGLLQRIYLGMTQLCRDDDPDRARHYIRLRNELEGSIEDGSQQNADFSATMLSQMTSLLEQFGQSNRGDDSR